MIKSKKGIVKPNRGFALSFNSREKKYDAVVKNYKCLFCQRELHITDIYESKCVCGSQWFEKLKALEGRRIQAV